MHGKRVLTPTGRSHDAEQGVRGRRRPRRSERPRSLRALGCDSGIRRQSRGRRDHGGRLHPGAGAALPEGTWPQMSEHVIAPPPTPEPSPVAGATDGELTGGWTGAVRRRAVRALPPDKLLPDTQPAYMASWIYVFGVLTVAALIVVLVTGGVLALKGPAWWHVSGTGKYVNGLHLWSVELFMFFM